MPVVYIDILFAVNLGVNYFILLLTARLTGSELRRGRLLLAAALGAVYAIFSFFPTLSLLNSLVCKLLIALTVAALAFGIANRRALTLKTFVFCALSCAFAGCMLAIYGGMGSDNGFLRVRNGVLYANIPLGVLLCAALILYLFMLVLSAFTEPRADRHAPVEELTVQAFGRKVRLRALMDSGSVLCDPLTNLPVLVAEYAALRVLFPGAVRAVLDGQRLEDAAAALEALHRQSLHAGFRLVPYRTVGTESGLLLAFSPTAALLPDGRPRRLLVALTATRLSENAAFTAILGLS